MESLVSILTVIHMICSVLIIVFVLLQFGKGAESGLFTQTGGGAVFTSSQQGNILTRITTVLAILFLGLSVGLAALRSRTADDSIFDENVPVEVPITPQGVDQEGTPEEVNPASPQGTDSPAEN